MARVLVTGSEGYIGRYAVTALRDAGHSVEGLDAAHLTDPYRLGGIFYEPRCSGYDVIVHLAALCHAQESTLSPLSYYTNNVGGLLDVLASDAPIIFASSCAVYGSRSGACIEGLDLRPCSPYGRTKAMGEAMLRDCDVPHIILRLANVAGGEGEVKGRIIPRAFHAARTGDPLILASGYDTFDGTPVRDFVHVADVCRAIVLAVDALLKGRSGMTINIGSGIATSMLEITQVVAEVTGKDVPWRTDPAGRQGWNPDCCFLDVAAAKRELGWSAEYGLREIARSHGPSRVPR